jgi:hypothetical protein
VALASLALSAATPLTLPRASSGAVRLAAAALALPVFYLACGTLLRPWLLDTIEAGDLRVAVRLAAALAATAALLVAWQWVRLSRWLESRTVSTRAAAALVVVAIAWHVAQFADWARHRTTRNYDASVALGQLLPAGTLVQGKLANGMSLENRIRPLFVGNHFGNYDDRLQRDDARYILTYDLPRIGYESSDGSGLIQGILDHYPRWRIIASFDVDETRLQDRAVLIDKFPDDSPAHARD